VHLELKDIEVLREQLAQQDQQVQVAYKDSKVHKEQQVQLDLKALRERQDIEVLREQLAQQDQQVQVVYKDSKELKEQQDQQVQQVLKVEQVQ
jgi:hypothetical protein